MTSESFAADLGNMIGDGSDLAPLMGTFSFSGRDPNQFDDEETKQVDSTATSRQTMLTLDERVGSMADGSTG